MIGESVCIDEAHIFSQSVEGITVELYSALEKSFVCVLGQVVIGGFGMGICGIVCG